jgi:ABC-2 type transport system ATP-binding protein
MSDQTKRDQLLRERLAEVAQYYQQGDVQLGFRRMMDAAIDTNNTALFFEMAAFTDWLEQQAEPDAQQRWERAQVLLGKIERAGVQPRAEAGASLLDAKAIKKAYRKGVFVLGPVDVSLRRGELLGLVGENGNGKTTLLRTLAQELQQDSGTIAYHLPYGQHRYDLRSHLAYIPQRTPKWKGPLKDNLKFTLASYGVRGEANEAHVLMIIARMGLWKYRNLNWNQLSSGYKMRFELARTFLRCPDLLLLDEPLANLDVTAQQTILEDLKSLANSLSRPMGIILSSQQLFEVEKVSDRVLFLRHGNPVMQEKNNIVTPDAAGVPAEAAGLIIEFDSDTERNQLQQALQVLPLEKLTYNGGTYVAYFAPGVSMPQVLTALGHAQVNVIYIRNISQSTRRFFIS